MSNIKEMQDNLISLLKERGVGLHKYDLEKMCFRIPGKGRICAVFVTNDKRYCSTYPTQSVFIVACPIQAADNIEKELMGEVYCQNL